MSSGMSVFTRTLLRVVGITNYCIRLVPFFASYCSRKSTKRRTSGNSSSDAASASPTLQPGTSDGRCTSHYEDGIMADFPTQRRTNVSLRAASSQNYTPLMRCTCHQSTEDETGDEGPLPGCSSLRRFRRNMRTDACNCHADCPCTRYLMRRQSTRYDFAGFGLDLDSASDSSSVFSRCQSDSSGGRGYYQAANKQDVQVIRTRGIKRAIVKFAQRYLHVHEVITEELIVDALKSYHGHGSRYSTNTIELTVIYCELLNVTKNLIEIFGILALNFGEHTEECLKAFSNFIMSFNLVIDEDSNYDPVTSRRVNEFYRSSIAATKVLRICDGTNIRLGDVVVHCTALYDIQRTVTGDYFHRQYSPEELKKASEMFCFITEYLDAALNFTQICLVLLGLPRSDWEESQNGEHYENSENVSDGSVETVDDGLRLHDNCDSDIFATDSELGSSDDLLHSISDDSDYSYGDDEFVNISDSDISSSCDADTSFSDVSDGNDASSERDSQSSLESDRSISAASLRNVGKKSLRSTVTSDADWYEPPRTSTAQSLRKSNNDPNEGEFSRTRFINTSNKRMSETKYGTIVRPTDCRVSLPEESDASDKSTDGSVYKTAPGPMGYEMLFLRGYNARGYATSRPDYGNTSTAIDYDIPFNLDVDVPHSSTDERKYNVPTTALDRRDTPCSSAHSSARFESLFENPFENHEVPYHTDEDSSIINMHIKNEDVPTKVKESHQSILEKESFQTRMHSAAFSAYDSGNYVYTYDYNTLSFVNPQNPSYNVATFLENNPMENYLPESGRRFYFQSPPSDDSAKSRSDDLSESNENNHPLNEFYITEDRDFNERPRQTWL